MGFTGESVLYLPFSIIICSPTLALKKGGGECRGGLFKIQFFLSCRSILHKRGKLRFTFFIINIKTEKQDNKDVKFLFSGEEVEFDVTGAGTQGDQSEMSSLTEFIRHQATD